jgi:hypothetical protein
MKTKSFFAIAIELFVTVSLVALLGLLIALVYALLSFLTPATAPQAATLQLTEAPLELTAATPVLAPTIYALPAAQSAPEIVTETPEETITDYAKMTVKQLKPLARDRKIPNWTKLNKKDLIAALSA